MFKHPSTYSPAPWPPRVGELVIIREKSIGQTNLLNGFCGVLLGIDSTNGYVRLLDSEDVVLKVFPIEELISTGKLPSDLVSMYTPSPEDFHNALSIERSFPDFDAYPRRQSSKSSSPKPSTKKTLKDKLLDMNSIQMDQLKKLLLDQLSANGIALKETK